MTFASDLFSGTSGTELATYSASWVRHSNYSSAPAYISSAGRARGDSTTPVCYYNTATPSSADYEVSADVAITSVGSAFTAGPVGRCNTTANTMYQARADGGDASWRLVKYVAGTFTQLGRSAKTFSASTTLNVRLRMSGSTIELYKEGEGTAAVSVTDTSISAAGYSGLRLSATMSDSLGFHLDAFDASYLSSGASVSGDTITLAQSLIAGAATGAASVAGVTVSQATEILAGGVSTGITVSGDVVALVTSLVSGAATGAAAATGTTIDQAESLIPGSVTTSGAVNVSGDTVVQPESLLPGLATGAALISGVTVAQSVAIMSGAVSIGISVSGAVVAQSYDLIAGTATGAVLIVGDTITEVASLLAGTVGSALTDSQKIDLILKILSDRQALDAGTGLYTLYDTDGTTVLYTAAAWEDVGGTQPYRGNGLARLDAMQ